MKQSVFGNLILASILSILAIVSISYVVNFNTLTLERKQFSSARGKSDQQFPGTGEFPLLIESDGNLRKITHRMGAVIIPQNPQRICSLSFTDELLTIGVKPIAASCTNGKFPDYLRDSLRGVIGINHLMGVVQPDFETLVEVQPDLILASSVDPQTYQQLSKIAPVVVMTSDSDNNRQRLLDLGKLLNHLEVAEHQVGVYDRAIEHAKGILKDRIGDRKVAFFRIHGKQFYIHGHTRGGIMLYDELGLVPPSLIASSSRGLVLSPETLLQLDADYIFVAAEANAGARRSWNSASNHPAWLRIPAVKAGHVYSLVEQHQWLVSGFLAKSRMLEEIMASIAPDIHIHVPAPFVKSDGEL